MAIPTRTDYQLPSLGEHIQAKKRQYQQALPPPAKRGGRPLTTDRPAPWDVR